MDTHATMTGAMTWGFPLFWLTCVVAAFVYAQDREIPPSIVAAALPAFLLEATLFLSLGLESARARLERVPSWGRAGLLTVAGIVPYCVASLSLGSFDLRALAWIALAAAAASLWFVVLPNIAAVDILFLVMAGAVALSRFLQAQYVAPHPRLPLGVLGQMMWIRTCAFALLSVRRVQGVGFGFWPQGRDWRIGAAYYGILLPVAGLAAWAVGFGIPHAPPRGWQQVPLLAVGTFFGIMWVVALGEEFLFRGLLQQWSAAWLGNEWLALALASAMFGAVHLWYRGFPNWQFAFLAAVAGIFYGLAFRQAKSIRASMVTHALTVTTLRVFYS